MHLHKTFITFLSGFIALTLAACGHSAPTPTSAPTTTAEPEDAAAESSVYSATGSGHEEGLTVTIEVLDGKVVGCVIDASHETPGIGGLAAPKLQEQIESGTLPDSLDAVVGATETCEGIVELYKDCLAQAGINY